MFTAYKPVTLRVEADLLYRPVKNPKPHVVGLVLTLDAFTVPRVRLYTEALALALFRLSDGFDPGVTLTFEILSDEVF